jgi:predicted N-formylglutamate amidohydrolase
MSLDPPVLQTPLLQADEPDPVMLARSDGTSDFVIVVDHAGRRIPRLLGDLGVPAAELERHIAWDIGAWAVAQTLAQTLDAALIGQAYSRLVIDCNRDPSVESAVATLSETTPIPGNVGVTAAEIGARRAAIFDPYHDQIRALLDDRQIKGRRTVLIALHSMTHIYMGDVRPMQCAVLYNRDARFASILLEVLRREPGLTVGDNAPYSVSDASDYTIPRHGEERGLAHVEIEMRQDLITGETGRTEWAKRLAGALRTTDALFRERHP